MMKSVSIFVDVQNVYYTVKQEYGRNFNYKALEKSNQGEAGSISDSMRLRG